MKINDLIKLMQESIVDKDYMVFPGFDIFDEKAKLEGAMIPLPQHEAFKVFIADPDDTTPIDPDNLQAMKLGGKYDYIINLNPEIPIERENDDTPIYTLSDIEENQIKLIRMYNVCQPSQTLAEINQILNTSTIE